MIDINKKYRTRDGRDARVICTDRKSHNYPVVALITENGEEHECTYTVDGRYADFETESDLDLIEISEPRVIWANEYTHGGRTFYSDEQEAKSGAHRSAIRVAVKYIEAL